MNQTPLAALVGAVTLVTGVLSARADDKPKVGITVAVKVNVSDIEARILSDALARALRDRFDVEVVAGEDAESRLPEEGLPETCIAETECLSSTADALGVETLLVLVAVRVGDSVQVDTTLFDKKTGSSNTRPPVRMTDRERQWQEAFAGSAEDILPGAPARATHEVGPSGGPGDVGNTGDTGTGGGDVGAGPVVSKSPPGFLATRTTLSWVLGGLTVAAVGAGTYFGLRALELDSRTPSECPSDNQCGAAKISTASFVAAGLLGAGFVYTFFFTEKPIPANTERAVGLQPGPGDLGLAIGGRF